VDPRRRIGHTRLADQFAVSLEREAHRHLHAFMCVLVLGRLPARPQGREQVGDGVDPMVAADRLALAILGALDGQLQIFPERKGISRDAGPALEHAANVVATDRSVRANPADAAHRRDEPEMSEMPEVSDMTEVSGMTKVS